MSRDTLVTERGTHSELPELTEALIQQLMLKGEDQQLEFKAKLPEPGLLARYIAGFANAGGGFILVGVSERQGVVGADARHVGRVYDAALRLLSPRPETTLKEYQIEGTPVCAIRVQRSDQVILAAGSAVVRVGEVLRAIDHDNIARKMAVAASTQTGIDGLIQALSVQSAAFEKLRTEVIEAGSLKQKLKDWVIGGTVGYIIGVIPPLIWAWMKTP